MPYYPRIVFCRAGEGPGEGTEGGGRCGEEPGSGTPALRGACSASFPQKTPCGLRFDSGWCSLLSYCTSVACRSLIYVSLVWAQSRDSDGPVRVWLCDFSVGRSVVGAQQCWRGRLMPSVWVRSGCGGPRGDRWDTGSALSRDNPVQ